MATQPSKKAIEAVQALASTPSYIKTVKAKGADIEKLEGHQVTALRHLAKAICSELKTGYGPDMGKAACDRLRPTLKGLLKAEGMSVDASEAAWGRLRRKDDLPTGAGGAATHADKPPVIPPPESLGDAVQESLLGYEGDSVEAAYAVIGSAFLTLAGEGISKADILATCEGSLDAAIKTASID